MTSIGVIGNCQALGIAKCLQGFVPDLKTTVLSVGKIASLTDAEKVELLKQFDSCDFVLSQYPEFHNIGPFSVAELTARGGTVHQYPSIVFTGLHPDCLTIPYTGGRIHGPIWTYHSAIVAAAYLEGLTEARAAKLFNAYTYSALGYFAQYDLAKESLIGLGEGLGFDLRKCFAGSSTMMHTVDHASIGTLAEVSRQAMALAGVYVVNDAALPRDDLATFIWPTYPELAARIGTTGSLRFQRWHKGQTAQPEILSLEEFIRESYAAFSAIKEPFSRPPIERARAFIRDKVVFERKAPLGEPVNRREMATV